MTEFFNSTGLNFQFPGFSIGADDLVTIYPLRHLVGMIGYKAVCLYCEGTPSLETYSCDCDDKEWTDEYRSIEILLDSDDLKQKIGQAFKDYDLRSPQGILQYDGIPNRSNEDSFKHEVGGTELIKTPVFENHSALQFYIKNEGANPSGCFKDRETVSCWLHARKKKRKKAIIYSSGNAAASAAWICLEKGMDLIAVVPGDTYEDKIDFIRSYGSDVIIVGDDTTAFESGYSPYAKLASSAYFFDHGFDDWSVRNPFRIEGDKTIALEVVKQIQRTESERSVPDYVIIPTANGSCLTGVWKGFEELKKASVIDKLPKMVSVGIQGASPIYKAVQKDLKKRPAKRSMEDLSEKDKKIGSIILAEEGYDSVEGASAVRASDGLALEMRGNIMKEAYTHLINRNKLLMNRHELLPEPASVLSIAAVEKLLEDHNIVDDACIVSLVTGHGMNSERKLLDMLDEPPGRKEVIQPIINRKKNSLPKKSGKKGKLVRSEANLTGIKKSFKKLLNTQA